MSDLARFREETDPVEVSGPVPVKVTDLSRQILVFDQSIANTGYALIYGDQIAATGNLKTEVLDKGHEDTLRRGVVVYEAVAGLLIHFMPTHILHEIPPVGGKMMRPEASLVASMGIRIAAKRMGLPVAMMGSQKAKKRWTGNGNAKKKAMKEAMLRLHPWLSTIKPMNEAIIDALAIGFLAAEMTDEEVGWNR